MTSQVPKALQALLLNDETSESACTEARDSIKSWLVEPGDPEDRLDCLRHFLRSHTNDPEVSSVCCDVVDEIVSAAQRSFDMHDANLFPTASGYAVETHAVEADDHTFGAGAPATTQSQTSPMTETSLVITAPPVPELSSRLQCLGRPVSSLLWTLSRTGRPRDVYHALTHCICNPELPLSIRVLCFEPLANCIGRMVRNIAHYVPQSCSLVVSKMFERDGRVRTETNLTEAEAITIVTRFIAVITTGAGAPRADDEHRVAPSSILATALRMITFFAVRLRHPESLPFANKELVLPNLETAATDSENQIGIGNDDEVNDPIVLQSLQSLTWHAVRLHPDLLLALERINLVTPGDQGCGDLEVTPIGIASLGLLLFVRQYAQGAFPLVVSPLRFFNIAMCSSFVFWYTSTSFPSISPIQRRNHVYAGLQLLLTGLQFAGQVAIDRADVFDSVFHCRWKPVCFCHVVLRALSYPQICLDRGYRSACYHAFRSLLSRFRWAPRSKILVDLLENRDGNLALDQAGLAATLITLKEEWCKEAEEALLKQDGKRIKNLASTLLRVISHFAANEQPVTQRSDELLCLLNWIKLVLIGTNFCPIRVSLCIGRSLDRMLEQLSVSVDLEMATLQKEAKLSTAHRSKTTEFPCGTCDIGNLEVCIPTSEVDDTPSISVNAFEQNQLALLCHVLEDVRHHFQAQRTSAD
eukprot:GHVT01021178.1.p1 GENE.GHVT01021178.1~~GHVT01021178.1.p1  ORF type:complete len:698 (-),score=18.68 GHVT01021178.1:985-3078(-)